MELTMKDRGDVMHFAGRQHLSPALDEQGRPAFSGKTSEKLVRCGWETFFEALAASHLALVVDPADPASARFVSEASAPPPSPGQTPREALARARRFLGALRGGKVP
jgi:hypothetical protein